MYMYMNRFFCCYQIKKSQEHIPKKAFPAFLPTVSATSVALTTARHSSHCVSLTELYCTSFADTARHNSATYDACVSGVLRVVSKNNTESEL